MSEPFAAFGATSFAFLVLGKCVEAFVLLSTARDVGKVGVELICLLNIQEVRLIEWAKRSGLLDEAQALDPRLNGRVIETILGELESLLGDVDKLALRYRFALVADDLPDTHLSTPRGLIECLVPDKTRRDILARARLIKGQNSWPKRMRWAAVDADKFKELISKVSNLIGELERFHDALVRDDMAQALVRLLSSSIRQCNTPGQARTLQTAIGMFEEGSERQQSLRSLAELRGAVLTHPDLSNESPRRVMQTEVPISRSQLLDFGKVTDFTNFGGGDALAAGKYDGQEVFLEFRTTPDSHRARGIIIQRAKSLALFLISNKPLVFRSLRCQGVAIAPDNSRLFFVFDLPRSGNHPVSLQSLFSSKQSLLPSVEARLKLAERLIEALRFVLISGWLHRNFRSENILFFTSHTDVESFELTIGAAPYLAGFAFARKDEYKYSEDRIPEPKQDIYRHPAWLEDVFQRAEPFMDVYSLGLVLLEIAAWQPLADIVQRRVDVNRTDLEQADIRKVRQYVQERSTRKQNGLYLPYRMGSVYASCVQSFLGIERGETEQALDILHNAAEKLRQCSV